VYRLAKGYSLFPYSEKSQNMLISKWGRPVSTLLVVAVLLFLPAARPAAADNGAHVYDLHATVSVANFTMHPPNPCFESIQLNGSFEIQAHIVYPPGPPGEPAPGFVANLHLNAEGITGTGLTTGTMYLGGQGSTVVSRFETPPTSFQFDSAFELRPSSPNLHPPNPCHVPLTFYTTIAQTDSGPQLFASLSSPTDVITLPN
jgi:hypothetical protein